MASKITKQDDKAIEYLESARKNLGLTQEEMAEECGVSIAQYKRYIYKKCKIPAVTFISLAESGTVDCDFILTGRKEPAKVKFTQLLSAFNRQDLISILYEAYTYYSQREREREIKEQRRGKEKISEKK